MLPVGVRGYMTDLQAFYNEMAVVFFMFMRPLIIFFVLAGKYMVKGLTIGAFK